MLLHTNLKQSFPSNSQEKVRIEIGVLEDGIRRKLSATFNLTLDINQYVAFIGGIDKMDSIPLINITYLFGIPHKIEREKR